MAGGKKSFADVRTKKPAGAPRTLEELLRDDEPGLPAVGEAAEAPPASSPLSAPSIPAPAPQSAQPVQPAEPLPPARSKARKIPPTKGATIEAKWGRYCIQKNFRLPIALLERLNDLVARRKTMDPRATETSVVIEALTALLETEEI